MTKVLLIHNTKLRNRDYLQKVHSKYPILRDNSDILQIDVIRVGKILKEARYDSIYFDKSTVKVQDITPYIIQAGHPQLIPIDIDPMVKGKNRPRKNLTFVVSPITDMKEGK